MTTTLNESIRNGVDTATLFATLDAVKAAPEAARFQFRAANEWLSGTHSRSTIRGFYGVGEERTVNPPEAWRTRLCGFGPPGLCRELFVVDG
jgi:hypothetical protein